MLRPSASALAIVLALTACSSRDRERSEERFSSTADEPLEIAPPPLIDDGPTPLGLPAPQTYEVLDALTRLMIPVPSLGECAVLAGDAPGEPLGAILAGYVRDADTREVACVPAPGGFQCRVSLVKSTGGEDEEYGLFLDLQLDAAHAIEPGSIVCEIAG